MCYRVSLMRDEADLRDLHGASPDRSVLGFYEYRFDPCQHTISHLELGAGVLDVLGRG